MQKFNFEKVSTLVAKVGIILLILVPIMVFIFQCCVKKVRPNPTLKNNSGVLDHGAPPDLHLFGRSRSETISINAFAHILHDKGYSWKEIIVSYRPPILKNPETGRCLEIDAYHPASKIGIEYNGIQHYKFPNHLHLDTEAGKKAFDEGVARDNLKRRLCKENGIHLIEIPYWIDTCVQTEGEWVFKRNGDEDKWKKIHKFINDCINKIGLCSAFPHKNLE